MRWNQFFGGMCIGLGFGLFLGGAIVDATESWNSASSAGFGGLLAATGVIATQRDRQKQQPGEPGPSQ